MNLMMYLDLDLKSAQTTLLEWSQAEFMNYCTWALKTLGKPYWDRIDFIIKLIDLD